jgi:geranylgeranyl diphosphate synthase type I
MSFQEDTQGMRSAIEAEMQQFIDRMLPADYPELRSMLTYHMGWEGEGAGPDAQGKRIRPLLVLLCAEAAGGEWRRALPAAVAVELLHNFSLIHDDIQDNSPLRRNRPTVWVKWGAAQGINAGDVMFTLAFLAIQELASMLPPQDVLLANRILQHTCLRLTEGQYLDMAYEKKPKLPIDAYWPMIGGKTSALLACCCELGALVAGTSEERRVAFHAYGYSLGLAFQVLDDWLGIWGDTVLTGKSAESDLVSGKKTLPVVFALSKDSAFARRWMQGSIKPEEVPALAGMLEEEGAQEHTLQTAEKLTQQALDALRDATAASQSDCAREAAQSLHSLTQALLRRKS